MTEVVALILVRILDDLGYLCRSLGVASLFDPDSYSSPYHSGQGYD